MELRGSHDYVLPGMVAALKTLPRIPQTLTICTDDISPTISSADGGVIDVLRRLVALRHAADRRAAGGDAERGDAASAARPRAGGARAARRPDRASDLRELDAPRTCSRRAAMSPPRAADRHGAGAPPCRRTRCMPPLSAGRSGCAHRQRYAGPAAHGGETTLHRMGRDARCGPRRDVVLPDDAIIMAMIHRHGRAPAAPVLGILRGWSTWRGAIATSVLHDSHNLTVFGRDPADMAPRPTQ